MTLGPLDTPDALTKFNIHFEKGVSVKVVLGDHKATDSIELFKLLNKIRHDNGVVSVFRVQISAPSGSSSPPFRLHITRNCSCCTATADCLFAPVFFRLYSTR
jgi:hypothetical protein